MVDPQPWPPVSREARTWVPSTAWGLGYREVKPQRYESAVPAQIAKLRPEPDEFTATLGQAATLELSRFDAELGSRVAAFGPVLLRTEAASSSQIENLTASARAIFSAELGVKRSRNAELIAANTRTMQAAIDLADALSAGAVLRMHAILMADQSHHTPGVLRVEDVWVGTRSDAPIGADYVAPNASRVPPLLEDLVAFCTRVDIPPLTLVAIAHAQFETIHPFTDGNGRTGRALAQALLRATGVTRNVAVPVSAGLLADVGGYHKALTAYQEGDVSPIVGAFANAALRAVANARELVAEIDAIREGWNHKLAVRRNSNAWKLLDVVARRPVLNSATAAEELGVKQPNVYPPLRALVDAGILTSKNEHRLGPFWRSDDLLRAIDRFAERAGRRGAP